MKKNLDYNDPSPLYEQVEKDIKRRIREGSLHIGDIVGSHNTLSKEYDVSIITIKKALLNLVNQGYLMTRVGKGTFVASINPNPPSNLLQQRTIGLVLQDLKHPFFSMIVHSIEQRAYHEGFNLLLSSSSNKIEKEEALINHFKSLNVDGLIIASLSLQFKSTSYLQKLQEDNFPYVMISYIHDQDYWYVGTDQELGGFMAAEFLIKNNYHSIGFVNSGPGNLLGEIRKNGYARALKQYSIKYNPKFVYDICKESYDSGSDRYESGYRFAKKFFKFKKRPEALFFYNDVIALGFMQSALEMNFNIPEDLAIIGFDDIEIAKFSAIPLTTIRQPVDKIGEAAVEILKKRINGKEAVNRTVFKPELVIRKTCCTNLM